MAPFFVLANSSYKCKNRLPIFRLECSTAKKKSLTQFCSFVFTNKILKMSVIKKMIRAKDFTTEHVKRKIATQHYINFRKNGTDILHTNLKTAFSGAECFLKYFRSTSCYVIHFFFQNIPCSHNLTQQLLHSPGPMNHTKHFEALQTS